MKHSNEDKTAPAEKQDLYEFLNSQDLQEAAIYWDVNASDGSFGENSTNGPFLLYIVLGQDPADQDETYNDLFISDWYIGYHCRRIKERTYGYGIVGHGCCS